MENKGKKSKSGGFYSKINMPIKTADALVCLTGGALLILIITAVITA